MPRRPKWLVERVDHVVHGVLTLGDQPVIADTAYVQVGRVAAGGGGNAARGGSEPQGITTTYDKTPVEEAVMRMLLTAIIDTEAGNEASRSGTLADITNQMIASLKPEAAYFVPQDGQRACFVVFDLADPSQIPVISEPMFLGAKAKITLSPCMNLEDLQRGLAEVARETGTVS